MNARVLLLAGALLFVAWAIARVIRTQRFSLHDKVALITGGSRGLGLVLARQICADGGKVALIARDADELSRAKADLVRRGGEVLTVQCDLLDAAQIPPEMRMWGGGRIVNISSTGGKMAVPHLAPYSASKFALTGFSDALRAELARDNICVTTVAPGMMRTGSHVNARFKGKRDVEFAWFAASAGAPLISMNAERAARKILAACRRGQPSLTLTFAARTAILGNALFPNLTGYGMKIVNCFLPKAADKNEGDESRAGSETRRLVPAWMTRLADRATLRNNEIPRE